MVWKQDLAKLKQQFKESGEPKPKVPIPKPMPKIRAAESIEEEDALFLNAMGRPQPQAKVPVLKERSPESVPEQEPAGPPTAAPLPASNAEDFESAMGGLKGLKPLPNKVPAKAEKPRPTVKAAPAPPPVPEKTPAASIPSPSESAPVAEEPQDTIRRGPTLIHLAAGMAIEVDGSLDLRGHTTVDAMERFRERLQDGVFLGWRTLHVTLGTSEELQSAFLTFLGGTEAHALARYAQAPIPMGGNQAWILYYLSSGSH